MVNPVVLKANDVNKSSRKLILGSNILININDITNTISDVLKTILV